MTWLVEMTIESFWFHLFIGLTALLLAFLKKWKLLWIHLSLLAVMWTGVFFLIWFSDLRELLPLALLLFLTGSYSFILLGKRIKKDRLMKKNK